MSLTPIPTLTDGTQAYRQRTRLDGSDWILDFVYNERRGRWAMSILDQDSNPVLTGQPIVCGVQLLRRAVGGPPGELVCVYAGEKPTAPGLTELGGRCTLWYLSADDALLEGTT